tara:strand:- start:7171 stop:7443 length:273 start_codon:yes stop_codon:yes gene_type:complete
MSRTHFAVGYKTGQRPAHEAPGARPVGSYMDNMGGNVRPVVSDWDDWTGEEVGRVEETPRCSSVKKDGGECQAFAIVGSTRCVAHQEATK